MAPFARILAAVLLALLWSVSPSTAFAEDDDDDSSVANDDDSVDDDDSSFFSGTVPLEDRVLGGGCEDGQSCSVGAGANSGLPLLLLAAACVRRRR